MGELFRLPSAYKRPQILMNLMLVHHRRPLHLSFEFGLWGEFTFLLFLKSRRNKFEAVEFIAPIGKQA